MVSLRMPKWRAVLPQYGDRVLSAFLSALASRLPNYAEVAELTAVSPSTVTRWAQGEIEPSLEQMRSVSEALHQRAKAVAARIEAVDEILRLTDELSQPPLARPDGEDLKKWAREVKKRTQRLDKLLQESELEL